MKYLLKNIACAIMLLTVFNCTTEPVDNLQEASKINQSQDMSFDTPDTPDTNTCNGDIPRVRITNNGTANVNFEIYDGNGNMVHHERDITSSSVTNWTALPVGEITFAVSNINADKIVVFDADYCMDYELVIDSTNQLNYSVVEED